MSNNQFPLEKAIKLKRTLIDQYVTEGMTVFNSCLRAGLTPEYSLKYEKLINDDILKKRFHLLSQRDICERRGITVGAILDKLKECAGLGEFEGATRTISAVNTKRDATASSTDFIEVPDWYTRIRAMHELCLIAGFIETKARGKEDDDSDGLHITIVRANTAVVQGGKGNNNAVEANLEAAFELKRAQ